MILLFRNFVFLFRLLILLLISSPFVSGYILGDGTALCFDDGGHYTGTSKQMFECPRNGTNALYEIDFVQVPDLNVDEVYTLKAKLTLYPGFFDVMCSKNGKGVAHGACNGLDPVAYINSIALPIGGVYSAAKPEVCDDAKLLGWTGQTLKDNCMFHHINVHSCPTINLNGESQVCRPYVSNSAGLATHTKVQYKMALMVADNTIPGSPSWPAGGWKIVSDETFPVNIDPTTTVIEYMTIAHWKITGISFAAGWQHKVNSWQRRTVCPTVMYNGIPQNGVPNLNGTCGVCPEGYRGSPPSLSVPEVQAKKPAELINGLHTFSFNQYCLPCGAGSYNEQSTTVYNPNRVTEKDAQGNLIPFDKNYPTAVVFSKDPTTYTSNVQGVYSCAQCSPGNYQPLEGQKSCLPCAPGSHQNGNGAKLCFLCPPGNYQPSAQQAECLRAPEGHYVSTEGATAPTACPHPSMVTGGDGYTSEKDCVCSKGTFWNGGSCEKCPKGFTCQGGRDITHPQKRHFMPKLMVNHWASLEKPNEAFYCRNKYRCPGGIEPTQATNTDQFCGPNMTGRSCGKCKDGYYTSQQGAGCDKCTGLQTLMMILLIIFAILSLCGVYILANSALTVEMSPALSFSMSVGVTIGMFQALGILSSMALDWPSPLKEIMDVMKLFVFDFKSVGPECVFGPGAVPKLLVRQVLPIFIAVFYFVGVKSGKMNLAKAKNSFGMLFAGFFAAVSSGALAPMSCYSNPNGLKTMLSMPDILCDTAEESDYTSLLLIGIITMILFPVAGFGYICKAVSLAPTKGEDAEWIISHRFLLFRFRFDRYYWMPFYLFRNTMICLPQMFVVEAQGQALAVVLVLLMFLVLQILVWPWRSNRLNRFDAFSTVCIVLIITAWFPTTDQEVADKKAYSQCATVCLVFLFTGMMYMLVKTIVEMKGHMQVRAVEMPWEEYQVRTRLTALIERWKYQSEERLSEDLEHLFDNLSPIDYQNFQALLVCIELTIGIEKRTFLIGGAGFTSKRIVLGADRHETENLRMSQQQSKEQAQDDIFTMNMGVQNKVSMQYDENGRPHRKASALGSMGLASAIMTSMGLGQVEKRSSQTTDKPAVSAAPARVYPAPPAPAPATAPGAEVAPADDKNLVDVKPNYDCLAEREHRSHIEKFYEIIFIANRSGNNYIDC